MRIAVLVGNVFAVVRVGVEGGVVVVLTLRTHLPFTLCCNARLVVGDVEVAEDALDLEVDASLASAVANGNVSRGRLVVVDL